MTAMTTLEKLKIVRIRSSVAYEFVCLVISLFFLFSVLSVYKLHRYTALALDTRVTAIICSWIYPQIILEDDYVCEPCRDLAIAAVNNNLQNEVPGTEEAGPSTSRGHTNVCLLCGCSILQRQSDKILKGSPNEMQQTIITIIKSKLAPLEVTPSDRVCYACWLRTKRDAV